ncbi:MAG: hypothetical protein CL693_19145 [Cellvibrionaceae bacterium]|nr:hypothetical protein [Cellvibrionaceae bacterium]
MWPIQQQTATATFKKERYYRDSTLGVQGSMANLSKLHAIPTISGWKFNSINIQATAMTAPRQKNHPQPEPLHPPQNKPEKDP